MPGFRVPSRIRQPKNLLLQPFVKDDVIKLMTLLPSKTTTHYTPDELVNLPKTRLLRGDPDERGAAESLVELFSEEGGHFPRKVNANDQS